MTFETGAHYILLHFVGDKCIDWLSKNIYFFNAIPYSLTALKKSTLIDDKDVTRIFKCLSLK